VTAVQHNGDDLGTTLASGQELVSPAVMLTTGLDLSASGRTRRGGSHWGGGPFLRHLRRSPVPRSRRGFGHRGWQRRSRRGAAPLRVRAPGAGAVEDGPDSLLTAAGPGEVRPAVRDPYRRRRERSGRRSREIRG